MKTDANVRYKVGNNVVATVSLWLLPHVPQKSELVELKGTRYFVQRTVVCIDHGPYVTVELGKV